MAVPPVVTIFGGSGFVGRYIARQMAQRGWRVKVAVRRPNEALFVRTYGVVGQVEPVLANIRDDASTAAAIAGAHAVVNCVGILAPTRFQDFSDVHEVAAERIARLSAAAGVRTLTHLSAIGADADGPSDYAKSKAAGEAAVRAHFPDAVILRPSVIFGVEDRFTNKFANLMRFMPVMMIPGAQTDFQPVYVDDVARAAAEAALGHAAAGVYELGGPDVVSLGDLLRGIAQITRRRRLILPMPKLAALPMAAGLDLLAAVTFGLIPNTLITRDQLKSLSVDNVAAEGSAGFAALGITPQSLEAVLPSYLYRYRPYGQYTEMTESASDLG